MHIKFIALCLLSVLLTGCGATARPESTVEHPRDSGQTSVAGQNSADDHADTAETDSSEAAAPKQQGIPSPFEGAALAPLTSTIEAEYDLGHSGIVSLITFQMQAPDHWAEAPTHWLEGDWERDSPYHRYYDAPPWRIRVFGFHHESSVQTLHSMLSRGEDIVEVGINGLSILRTHDPVQQWYGYGLIVGEHCILVYFSLPDGEDLPPIDDAFDASVVEMLSTFEILELSEPQYLTPF